MNAESVVGRFVRLHSTIRDRFPQMIRNPDGTRRVYLNSGGGTLMVDAAVDALTRIARSANPQPGDTDPAEIATCELHWRVRQIVADFINAERPEEISFHGSATHALFNLAYSLRSVLTKQSNLVVTDLDHLANVSPWEDFWGREKGCQIRRAGVDPSGCLDVDHLISLIDEKTGLVALPLASNGFGSVVPVMDIIPLIRQKAPGCLVCIDAVHHALHGSIDVRAMDCDFLIFSGYKVFGPVIGLLWGKADVLDRLEPYRVAATEDKAPYKLEQGTLNNAVLASLEGALNYLLWLSDQLSVCLKVKQSRRRETFTFVMDAIALYEEQISRIILEGFQRFDKDKFRCYGVTNVGQVRQRDPTFSFDVHGRNPREVKEHLWAKHRLQIADGDHYSAAIYRHLARKSICRASFAHYDTYETAKVLVEALGALCG